ncbi:unnamed protein product [Ambrosiozyma monospora]|uniref:Unnamed protein product n=1 Tax=Ambrosiozyma monospora TaxID=43982 RepID=A0ACB5SRD7_AMBMO|nr:unnamed protein product [Ambrosiozyma monospora]
MLSPSFKFYRSLLSTESRFPLLLRKSFTTTPQRSNLANRFNHITSAESKSTINNDQIKQHIDFSEYSIFHNGARPFVQKFITMLDAEARSRLTAVDNIELYLSRGGVSEPGTKLEDPLTETERSHIQEYPADHLIHIIQDLFMPLELEKKCYEFLEILQEKNEDTRKIKLSLDMHFDKVESTSLFDEPKNRNLKVFASFLKSFVDQHHDILSQKDFTLTNDVHNFMMKVLLRFEDPSAFIAYTGLYLPGSRQGVNFIFGRSFPFRPKDASLLDNRHLDRTYLPLHYTLVTRCLETYPEYTEKAQADILLARLMWDYSAFAPFVEPYLRVCGDSLSPKTVELLKSKLRKYPYLSENQENSLLKLVVDTHKDDYKFILNYLQNSQKHLTLPLPSYVSPDTLCTLLTITPTHLWPKMLSSMAAAGIVVYKTNSSIITTINLVLNKEAGDLSKDSSSKSDVRKFRPSWLLKQSSFFHELTRNFPTKLVKAVFSQFSTAIPKDLPNVKEIPILCTDPNLACDMRRYTSRRNLLTTHISDLSLYDIKLNHASTHLLERYARYKYKQLFQKNLPLSAHLSFLFSTYPTASKEVLEKLGFKPNVMIYNQRSQLVLENSPLDSDTLTQFFMRCRAAINGCSYIPKFIKMRKNGAPGMHPELYLVPVNLRHASYVIHTINTAKPLVMKDIKSQFTAAAKRGVLKLSVPELGPKFDLLFRRLNEAKRMDLLCFLIASDIWFPYTKLVEETIFSVLDPMLDFNGETTKFTPMHHILLKGTPLNESPKTISISLAKGLSFNQSVGIYMNYPLELISTIKTRYLTHAPEEFNRLKKDYEDLLTAGSETTEQLTRSQTTPDINTIEKMILSTTQNKRFVLKVKNDILADIQQDGNVTPGDVKLFFARLHDFLNQITDGGFSKDSVQNEMSDNVKFKFHSVVSYALRESPLLLFYYSINFPNAVQLFDDLKIYKLSGVNSNVFKTSSNSKKDNSIATNLPAPILKCDKLEVKIFSVISILFKLYSNQYLKNMLTESELLTSFSSFIKLVQSMNLQSDLSIKTRLRHCLTSYSILSRKQPELRNVWISWYPQLEEAKIIDFMDEDQLNDIFNIHIQSLAEEDPIKAVKALEKVRLEHPTIKVHLMSYNMLMRKLVDIGETREAQLIATKYIVKEFTLVRSPEHDKYHLGSYFKSLNWNISDSNDSRKRGRDKTQANVNNDRFKQLNVKRNSKEGDVTIMNGLKIRTFEFDELDPSDKQQR